MFKIPDIKVPSEEDMVESFLKRIEASKDNPNCFDKWYPTVSRLGIPSPDSDVYEITPEALISVIKEEYRPELFYPVVDKIIAFGERFGYPLFMKNGLFSNKHDFKNSCLITKEDGRDDIAKKIMNINYNFMILSPDLSTKVVIRKFLDTEPSFYAFGSTPIVEEYRLFATDGVVEGYQAYWPKGSIIDPDVDDWKERLASISVPEEDMLMAMKKYAEVITKELGGYWSVDFLVSKENHPYLIDMAIGEQSFRDHDNFKKLI